MLTIEDVRAVMAFYHYSSCQSGTKPATSIDHVRPLAQGGTNKRENLQLLTVEEQKEKGNKEIDYRKGAICPDDFTPEIDQPRINRKHDWEKIKLEYVSNPTSTYEDLAKSFDVSFDVIAQRASAESWKEQRQEFIKNVSTELVTLVAQARAEQNIAAIDLCDTIITSFMREMARGKAKVTAFDAMAAARFREVLRGGVSSRSETVHKDWRDFARDAGLDEDEVYAEFERIANDRAGQVNAGGGSFGGREQEEYGAGWSD